MLAPRARRCVGSTDTPTHLSAPSHDFNATGTRPQHQRDQHCLNMPSPPLPTPRLHTLPDPIAHALRVQLQHPPRPTAPATPPPAPRPAASPPAGLYSASDRTPMGARTPAPGLLGETRSSAALAVCSVPTLVVYCISYHEWFEMFNSTASIAHVSDQRTQPAHRRYPKQ